MANRTLALAILCVLASPAAAQVKAFNTQGVRMEPLASQPSNCGASNPCVYYDSVAGAFKQINNAGTSSTLLSGSAYSSILNEGGAALPQRPTVNIIGTQSNCVDNAGQNRTDCTFSHPSAYNAVSYLGGLLNTRTQLNFDGAGVVCADNSGQNRTDCTISGTADTLQSAYTNSTGTPTQVLMTGTTKYIQWIITSSIGTTLGVPVNSYINGFPSTIGSQVQNSPATFWTSEVWDTDDALNRTYSIGVQVLPTPGTTVGGRFAWLDSIGAAAPTEFASINRTTLAIGNRSITPGGSTSGQVLADNGSGVFVPTTIASAADTLQTAYTAGNAIALASNAVQLTKDSLGNTTFSALHLRNTTAAANATSPQNSPAIFLEGRTVRTVAPTGAATSVWKIMNYPMADSTERTGQLQLLESHDGGSTFPVGMIITTYDQFNGGEVNLEALGPNSFLYPRAAIGDGPGTSAGFFGINGQQVKFGVLLASVYRVQFNSTYGFSPQTDLATPLGNLTAGTFRWSEVGTRLLKAGVVSEIGQTLPESSFGAELENFDAATNGAQEYSSALGWIGRAYDTAGSASRRVRWYAQLAGVQETSATPTINLNFSSMVATVNAASRIRATLRSGLPGNDDTNGGEFGTFLFYGLGAAPTLTAGAAGNCASTATVSGDGAAVSGYVQVITGAAACAAGAVVTVDIPRNAKGGTLYPVLFAENAATAAASALISVSVTDANTFVINVGGGGLTAATTYKWFYWTGAKN